MLNEVVKNIKDLFKTFFDQNNFTPIAEEYDEKAFGNWYLTLTNKKITIQLVLDRGQLLINLKSLFFSDWINLESISEFLKLKSPDINNFLDNEIFLSKHFSSMQHVLSTPSEANQIIVYMKEKEIRLLEKYRKKSLETN